jgi:hypothetical protein
VEVAKLAVREGVLPGPRQGARRRAAPAAFAAVWSYVGSYVGPSAAGAGHVGCVLGVAGKAGRTKNRHYRQADRFDVTAVLLRPWLFNSRVEIGRRQSCANSRLNPYDWGGGTRRARSTARGEVAEAGAGPAHGAHRGSPPRAPSAEHRQADRTEEGAAVRADGPLPEAGRRTRLGGPGAPQPHSATPHAETGAAMARARHRQRRRGRRHQMDQDQVGGRPKA